MAVPGAFSLLTPTDNAVRQLKTPVLDWGDSSGATTYNVQLEYFYGPGISPDALTNFKIGPSAAKLGYRFKCVKTGRIDTLIVYFIFRAAGYFAGDGGEVRIELQTDDGTGKPSGTVIGSYDIPTPMVPDSFPGRHVPGRAAFPNAPLSTTQDVVAGNHYHFVLSNPDSDPTNNWISINNMFNKTDAQDYNPGLPDDQLVLMQSYTGSGGWILHHDIPIIAYSYTDGTKFGSGYYEMPGANYTRVYGNNIFRQTITPAATVSDIAVISIRTHLKLGTPNDLEVILEETDGTLVESFTVSESSIGTDKDWIDLTCTAKRTLTAGKNYHIKVRQASNGGNISNCYVFFPPKGDFDAEPSLYGLTAGLFKEGSAWVSSNNGSTWQNMPNGSDRNDMQFYMTRRPIDVTGLGSSTYTIPAGTLGESSFYRWRASATNGEGTTQASNNDFWFHTTLDATVSGTLVAGINEGDVVAGGKDITVTVHNDTLETGATFDAGRQDVIDNVTSAQSEANGWNNDVTPALAVTDVTRIDDTSYKITLPAVATYEITSQETISVQIPSSILVTSSSNIAVTNDFSICPLATPTMPFVGPHANWDGTAGSGWGSGAVARPVDPARVNGKPITHNLREEHVEITGDYELCVDAFAALPRTKLDGALTDSATSMTVDSTADFLTSGNLLINNEKITYTGTTATTFTGLTRGVGTTSAAAHADNDKVMCLHKTGVEKVNFYIEGILVAVGDVTSPTDIADTMGSGDPPPTYIAKLDSSEFGDGEIEWYAESVPVHQQLEKRVIGPYKVYHNKNGTLVNNGTVYWCDDGAADDTGAGTEGDPLKTINGVLTKHFGGNADASGVTIKCKAGSYSADLNGSGNNHADGRPIIVTKDPAAAKADVIFDQSTTAEMRALNVTFRTVTFDLDNGPLINSSPRKNEITLDDVSAHATTLSDSPYAYLFAAGTLADGLKFNFFNSDAKNGGNWGKSDRKAAQAKYRGSLFNGWNGDVMKTNFVNICWNNVRMFGGRQNSPFHSDILQNRKETDNTLLHNVRIWDYNHQGGDSAPDSNYRDRAFINVLFGYNQNALHHLFLGETEHHIVLRNFACNNRFKHASLVGTIYDKINCHFWHTDGNQATLVTRVNSCHNNYHENSDFTGSFGDDPNPTNISQNNFFSNRANFNFEEGSATPTGITIHDWDILGNTRAADQTMVGPWKAASEGSSVDTTAPTTPGSPAAVNVSNLENTVTWTASTDNVQMDQYEIYSSTTSGFTPNIQTNLIGTVGHPSLSFSHINLIPDTTYYYVIKALDINGNRSSATSEVNATTPEPPPEQVLTGGGLIFLRVTGGYITFEVTPPS